MISTSLLFTIFGRQSHLFMTRQNAIDDASGANILTFICVKTRYLNI